MLNIEKSAETRAKTLATLQTVDAAAIQEEFNAMQQGMQPEMGAQGEPTALPVEMEAMNEAEQVQPPAAPAV